MKKIFLILAATFIFISCSNNDDSINYSYSFLPVDEVTAPASFTYGQSDTLKLKYTLPSGCYYFNDIYYEYQDTTRIVAIRAVQELETNCTTATIEKEYNLIVRATQLEDYVFKFWKGTDNNGENIFEEVVVPVN